MSDEMKIYAVALKDVYNLTADETRQRVLSVESKIRALFADEATADKSINPMFNIGRITVQTTPDNVEKIKTFEYVESVYET
jgi:hypothetical protein